MSRLKDLFKKSTNVQMSQSESVDQEGLVVLVEG